MESEVLVVEDEKIVAKHLQTKLKALGYHASATASSGQEAVLIAELVRPDLVLMDILLKGNIDGIEAARQIRDRFSIPVVYLTAHSDDATLQRAKLTEPLGYLLKPINPEELKSVMVMAFYRLKEEKRLKKKLQHIFGAIPAWLWASDAAALSWASSGARRLTGYEAEEFIHTPSLWPEIICGEDRPLAVETHRRARKERVSLSYECRIKHKDGTLRYLHIVVVPDAGADYGAVGPVGLYGFAFDVTDRKQGEQALLHVNRSLERGLESTVQEICRLVSQLRKKRR